MSHSLALRPAGSRRPENRLEAGPGRGADRPGAQGRPFWERSKLEGGYQRDHRQGGRRRAKEARGVDPSVYPPGGTAAKEKVVGGWEFLAAAKDRVWLML